MYLLSGFFAYGADFQLVFVYNIHIELAERNDCHVYKKARGGSRPQTVRDVPAALVAGPRQVGKTSLLEEVAQGVRQVTLDDMLLLASAVERGGTFFYG
jgi:predicted AAA+ superfamily ATPase